MGETRGQSREVADALPQNAEWRCVLVAAVATAVASSACVDGQIPAPVRMSLIVALRRHGLLAGPDQHAALRATEACHPLMPQPTQRRRIVSRAMRPLVGTPWADLVLTIAREAHPAAPPRALDAARLALGLAVRAQR
jgi:hypothetical protein